MKSSNTKKLHIHTAKSLFILRASAARYQKYVEKVGYGGPKNHFKWIFS